MVSYADIINLATALILKCDVFYSGDPDFKGIKEIIVDALTFDTFEVHHI